MPKSHSWQVGSFEPGSGGPPITFLNIRPVHTHPVARAREAPPCQPLAPTSQPHKGVVWIFLTETTPNLWQDSSLLRFTQRGHTGPLPFLAVFCPWRGHLSERSFFRCEMGITSHTPWVVKVEISHGKMPNPGQAPSRPSAIQKSGPEHPPLSGPQAKKGRKPFGATLQGRMQQTPPDQRVPQETRQPTPRTSRRDVGRTHHRPAGFLQKRTTRL